MVHGCSPLHFCFLRLHESHALLHRRRAPGAVLARGMAGYGIEEGTGEPRADSRKSGEDGAEVWGQGKTFP